MTVCKRVTYSGRVQGVGFRYTAVQLATGYAVGGHVRNLPSGEVELVAEGAAAEVAGFLAAVRGQMSGNIDAERQEELEASGRSGFVIRR